MTSKTVVEGSGAQGGSFRMGGIPGLAVGRYMATRDHDGIAFDWCIVYDTGMTGRTAFSLSTNGECLHMLPMAHDQPHIVHR